MWFQLLNGSWIQMLKLYGWGKDDDHRSLLLRTLWRHSADSRVMTQGQRLLTKSTGAGVNTQLGTGWALLVGQGRAPRVWGSRAVPGESVGPFDPSCLAHQDHRR